MFFFLFIGPFKELQWCWKSTLDGNEEKFPLCHFQLPLIDFCVQTAVSNQRYRCCSKKEVKCPVWCTKDGRVDTKLWPDFCTQPCKTSLDPAGHHWIQMERWSPVKMLKQPPGSACKHADCVCTMSSMLGFGNRLWGAENNNICFLDTI